MMEVFKYPDVVRVWFKIQMGSVPLKGMKSLKMLQTFYMKSLGSILVGEGVRIEPGVYLHLHSTSSD